MIVFSEIKRCQLPHFTHFFQKAKKGVCPRSRACRAVRRHPRTGPKAGRDPRKALGVHPSNAGLRTDALLLFLRGFPQVRHSYHLLVDGANRRAAGGLDHRIADVGAHLRSFQLLFLTFGDFLANFERPVLGCIEADFCK